MYVEFVNMFTDPTGFFNTAPIWVAFVLPGIINALLTISPAALVGLFTKDEDIATIAGWILGALNLVGGAIFWGIVIFPAFEAHGVNPGIPTLISSILGFLAMATGTTLATYLFSKVVSKYF